MSPIVIIIIIVFVIIFFLAYYYSPKKIILRRLKKLRYSNIRSLQNHKYAKVSGKALAIEKPLTVPLSQRKCVYYKIKIKKKVSNGDSSHWKTIIAEEEIQDFFIEQDGQKLLVFPKKNPRNFYEYLVTDKVDKSGAFKDPTPEFQSLLNKYQIASEGFFGFNKELRYEEAIIEVGEEITVAGIVKWMELDNPIVDYNYSRVASLVAKDKIKLVITDSPEALKTNKHL